jgi:N-acetylmuramoyl-L-alanine amidase
MGDRYLMDLADVCRRTGYPVIEVDGWQMRARGSGGYAPGQPTHQMIHHTASGPGSDGWPDVNYCTFGDDDAPLCNLYLARDGTIFVCAGGATNTNGSGSDPCGIVADDSMNSSAIGIEAGNDGQGETWPDDQLVAYQRLCAVLCDGYGIAVECIHAHWEWAPDRKVDPAGPPRATDHGLSWDMDAFRTDVTNTTPTPIPPPLEEDDEMAFLVLANTDWFVTDLASYRTYVPTVEAAQAGVDEFGWKAAGPGPEPFWLPVELNELWNSLPLNRGG